VREKVVVLGHHLPTDASTEWVQVMGIILYVIATSAAALMVGVCADGIASLFERYAKRRAKS